MPDRVKEVIEVVGRVVAAPPSVDTRATHMDLAVDERGESAFTKETDAGGRKMLANAKVAIAAALDEHDGHTASGERNGRGEPGGSPTENQDISLALTRRH